MKKNIYFILFCALLITLFPAPAPAQDALETCTVEPAAQPHASDAQDETIAENSLDENVAVSTQASAVPAYSDKVRTAVKQSEAQFKKALMYYQQGDNKKAGEFYAKSLETLSSSGLDAYAFSRSGKSMDEMFTSFTALFSLSTDTARQRGQYEIFMDTANPQVQKYLNLYSKGECSERIKKALERSGRYRPMIEKILREYGLPRELIYLPVVESLYNVNDRSRAGAVGLWQFMPSRSREFDMRVNYWIDERKDPEKSTRAAARYLRDLYYMFDNWHLALAAYNRGEYGLARDLKFSKATNIEQIKERRAVPKETEAYVPQFIACTIIGDNPKKYGFILHYDEPLKYDEVSLDRIVDLEVAAKCAGVSASTLKELNPALKAWCTPHGYPGFVLKIPAGTKDSFLLNLSQVKELNPSNGFVKYRVEKGDYIGRIAKKFSTSVTAIKEDNHIKNVKALRIGQVLVIRPGRKFSSK